MATEEEFQSNNISAKLGSPITSIITKEEIQRFIDLGLGRGIDTTDPDLWRNKRAFIVRHATFDNVIGTDEGNLAENYQEKVLSGNDMQEEFKKSVAKAATTPISIVLEAGASRSATSSRIVQGQRVVTRTISFNFTVGKHFSSDKKSFEDIVSKWIKRHEDMDEACGNFVRYFGITHYVTSITLGASVHSIFTQEEYAQEIQKKKKSKNIIKRKLKEAVAKLSSDTPSDPEGEVKETNSASLGNENIEGTTKHSSVRRLGVMNGNTVERGTTDEAVIGIRILPIHSLIEKKELREALRMAVIMYSTKNQGFASTGPYIVECEDQELYWTVNEEDNTLSATKIIQEASFFHIIPNEDSDDPYDFYIAWEKQPATLTRSRTGSMLRKRQSSSAPAVEKAKDYVFRYLQVKKGSQDDEDSKIQMKTCVHGSALSIYKPLVKEDDPTTQAELSEWMTKRRICFIQSSVNHQYLCVKKVATDSEVGYTYQVRFVKDSQSKDEKNTWMLFRLLPVRDDVSPTGQTL